MSCHVMLCYRPGVKPSTVLFGRNLPARFFESCEEDFSAPPVAEGADLLLVLGTSLVVGPANSLVHQVMNRQKYKVARRKDD
jgi:NAD-dependent SIR2 family protein deacetylase